MKEACPHASVQEATPILLGTIVEQISPASLTRPWEKHKIYREKNGHPAVKRAD